ncbi:MAG TPA: protein kinase [Phycisphaerae bacterium]|nr:protein kinase [Phycisphaerae bacterium]
MGAIDASSSIAATTIGLPRPRQPEVACPNVPDYRFIKVIGRGAFGIVWLAEEPLAGIFRAIKILDGGGRSRRDYARLTNCELEGLHAYQTKAQGHLHLVQIFKTGYCRPAFRPAADRSSHASASDIAPALPADTSESHVYYVMEIADHVRGAQPHRPQDYEPHTLSAAIRKERLPVEKAVGFAQQLLEAIEHLHESGIHHRDIKPGNILFVEGVLKLADVGLVGEASDESIGTSGYLPPEGKPDDLYAFGKVLYEMVTGLTASAFPEWPGDLDDSPAPSKTNVDESYSASANQRLGSLRTLINRLCHPSPSKRLADLAETRRLVAASLELRGPKTVRRSIAVPAICVAFLVGAALGLAGMKWRFDRQDPTKLRLAQAPYDGSEWRYTVTTGKGAIGLIRNHAQGGEYIIYGRVHFSDLQTRLDSDGKNLIVAGTYQVYSIENPVTGDVQDPRGEILQLFLWGGDQFVLLHHAQSQLWPGIKQRFVRTLPVDPVLELTSLQREVRLLAVPAVTPEEAIAFCRAHPEVMKDNSIRIACLAWGPLPTSQESPQ